MTVIRRSTKGSALTYDEVDENFRDLRFDTTLDRILENGDSSNRNMIVGDITANDIVANSITTSQPLYRPGEILQVQQTVYKNQFSSSGVFNESTWYHFTPLDVSVTAVADNSQFYIQQQVHAGVQYWQWASRITRNGTAITDAQGNAAGVRPQGTSVYNFYDASGGTATEAQYHIRPVIANYIDSPSNSAGDTLVYGIDITGYSDAYAIYINRSHAFNNVATYDVLPISTITVWEIAGSA